MNRVFACWLVLGLAEPALAQEPPPLQEDAGRIAARLIFALDHADSAVRKGAADALEAAALGEGPLRDKAIDALARAVAAKPAMPAARAAVVLGRIGFVLANDPQANAADFASRVAPRLRSVAENPHAESWRWNVAVSLLDKIAPEEFLSSAEPPQPGSAPARALLETALIPALRGNDPLRQFAAVQCLHHLGPKAKGALPALLALLDRGRCGFRGVYLSDQVLDDDRMAYAGEIGLYDARFRLLVDERFQQVKAAFVVDELLILETARRLGAAETALLPALIGLAHHPGEAVRLGAASQLVFFGPQAQAAAAGALASLLADPYSDFYLLLGDEDDQIRADAQRLLLQLGAESRGEVVPSLVGLLASRERLLRESAAVVLGRYGPSAAASLPALEAAKGHEALIPTGNPELMQQAIDLISGVPEEGAQPAPTPR